MTGKRYYLATVAAWQRHVPHCVETHFIILGAAERSANLPCSSGPVCDEFAQTDQRPSAVPPFADMDAANSGAQLSQANRSEAIFVVVTADEAAHIALENDAEVEALPHPLARTPISERAAAALAPLGVNAGDDTFTVAEKLARVNPLLRHRVF
jgi:hypothetical protein